jgi:hypothetical protein
VRLYYFTSQRYGLAAIRDRRLKVSHFSQLNDPADHVGIYVEGGLDRSALEKQREVFDTQGGIICMSTNWRESLLWGHYGENYKGICLVFDVDDEWWLAVGYVDRRPTLETFGKKTFEQLTERDIFALGLMKFENWRYEQEFRCFVPFENYDFVDNIYFKRFDETMALKGALFGFRSGVTEQQIKHILDFDDNIKLGFTRHSEKYFHVILDQAKSAERVKPERRIRYDENKTLIL